MYLKRVACIIAVAFSIDCAALFSQSQPLPAKGDTPPTASSASTPDTHSAPSNAQTSGQLPYTGIRKVGGGVSVPALTHSVEPQFSEEARANKVGGMVVVTLIVDINGRPQNVHVVRGVGMGLDEKAVQAVRQYRFKPAMEDGKPVPVQINVEVNFQIFQNPQDLANQRP